VIGIPADLRAFAAAKVHGTSAISLVTAHGTRGVKRVAPMPPELVRSQIEAVLDDLHPRAIKTGALGNASIVEIVADVLHDRRDIPLVVDPVVNPPRGRALLDDSGLATLARELIPLATIVMPNRDETSRLTGRARGIEDARRACKSLVELGARAVLVKGGHFTGNDAIDLYYDGKEFIELRSPRRDVSSMVGLGCTLSALVTAFLARGESLSEAVRRAHAVLQRAMAQPLTLGDGFTMIGALEPDDVAPTAGFLPRTTSVIPSPAVVGDA
jgi:hydroxymethylpyrimidine/phosphomethylpyrimidine kinase